MINFLKKLFDSEDDSQIANVLQKGAIVVDVRSKSEYASEHIPQAKHIVLTDIPKNLDKIKKWDKPVVAYCRSGRRSGIATQQMKNAGIEAYNGGGIAKMKSRLSQL